MKKSVSILSMAFLGGIILGIVFEKTIPSEYNFIILSEREIYNNNISTLRQTIGYGFLSFGLYSVYFSFIFGKLIGQGVAILFSNYGTNGVIYGFLPHAVIETVSCLSLWCLLILGKYKQNKIIIKFFDDIEQNFYDNYEAYQKVRNIN